MCHHTQVIFTFLVETGFHYLGQAGFKLLTSGDPPTLVYQTAGITGVATEPGLYFDFLIVGILTDMRWYLIVVLICISLMIDGDEHFFMFLGHLYFFF